MSNAAILNDTKRARAEIDSLEVAEDSRELNWAEPSFVADLFMGKLRSRSILPYPEQSDEDRRIGDEYIAKLRPFVEKELDGDAIDTKGEIPAPVMQGLAKLGCFGMKIPKEYGGLGLSQVNYNRALAFIATQCGSTGAMLSAHQSIGVPQPLHLFGTEAQKKKFLPRFAAGAVSAFALTEPEVGSDPAQMGTTATPTDDGHYLINGTKLWCTNGAIAEVLVVMARTPSIMKNGREKKQITAFIVESNTPGFEVVHRCRFMGLNGIQNALLKFTNVKVPKENIIWGEGKGLRLALVTLNAGRLSLPAACIGGGRQCVKVAREWGNTRKQWGAAIGKHEAGANKIGWITSHLFAMEAVTWLSGVWVDRKKHDIRIEAAMAKLFCSEKGHQMVEATLQLRGGRGYERVSSLKARGELPFPAERMVRDSRINQIVEGTSDIMRLFISREALDKHLSVAGDVLNSKLGIGKRLAALVKAGAFYAIWYPARWLAPLFVLPPMYGSLGTLAKHMRYADRGASKLARTIFHLMLLNGPKLEKKQMQLGRVVDIATDLFAMSATVARAHAKKSEPNALVLADLFCQEARLRIAENYRALGRNADRGQVRVTNAVLEGGLKWIEKESVDFS